MKWYLRALLSLTLVHSAYTIAMDNEQADADLSLAIALSLQNQDASSLPAQENDLDHAIALSLADDTSTTTTTTTNTNTSSRARANQASQEMLDHMLALSLQEEPRTISTTTSTTSINNIQLQSHRRIPSSPQQQQQVPSNSWAKTFQLISLSVQNAFIPREIIVKAVSEHLNKIGNNYECPICLEAYSAQDSKWVLASKECKHALCKECKKKVTKCPTCRADTN